MSRVSISEEANYQGPYSGFSVERALNVTPSNWHALAAGGAPLDLVAGFATPSAAECDRIPEIVAAAGGAAFVATITGTWNSAAQVEVISCPTNTTTKCTKPFDTITRFQTDVDPVSNTTLVMGDSYADPPARGVYTGTANGNLARTLSGETASQTRAVLASQDFLRRIRRVAHTTTTLVGATLGW